LNGEANKEATTLSVIALHYVCPYAIILYYHYTTELIWSFKNAFKTDLLYLPKNFHSFQLTILNERGRIWTLVAGGGASVIFADTIVEKSNVEDLANYGEYSGAPNEEQVSCRLLERLKSRTM